MDNTVFKYDVLEIARILGEPVDPAKRYPDIVEAIAETDTADPDEYVYYHDVLVETDKVVTITASGELSSEGVSPHDPTAFTFIDMASPEYYVKVTDLAKAKEATLARKLRTINRSLNAYENSYMTSLAAAAAATVSHQHDLSATGTRFSYDNLIYLLQDLVDYGDNYVLLMGANIDQDIKLWNWNDNKYHDLNVALASLNIERVRVNANVTIDGSSTAMLSTNKAYLIARSSEVGKPFLFVRKRLNDIELLGGAIKSNGEKPERLVFISPNPIAVTVTTAKRYLAVGLTGYQEIVCACINPYAVSEFTRLNTIGGTP